MKIKILFLTLFCLTSFASAMEEECFPDTTLRYPVMKRQTVDIRKTQVDKLITEFYEKNNHVAKKFLKKDLKIEHLWEEDRVNAIATFDLDDNPIIQLFGGVSRFPGISDDVIRLILCHELGHFIGGHPKKTKAQSSIPSWSSAEGQADYFSTSVCFKNYSDIKDYKACQDCESSRVCSNDQNCVRMAQASLELMRMWAKLKSQSVMPSLLDRDSTYVEATNLNYPSLQCRLDTLVNGSRCSYKTDSYYHQTEIACSNEDEQTLRPSCWFFE